MRRNTFSAKISGFIFNSLFTPHMHHKTCCGAAGHRDTDSKVDMQCQSKVTQIINTEEIEHLVAIAVQYTC